MIQVPWRFLNVFRQSGPQCGAPTETVVQARGKKWWVYNIGRQPAPRRAAPPSGGLSSLRLIREGAANEGINTGTPIFEQLQSSINLQLYHNSVKSNQATKCLQSQMYVFFFLIIFSLIISKSVTYIFNFFTL